MKRIFGAIRNYVKYTDKILLLLCVTASGLSVLLITGIYYSGLIDSKRTIVVQMGAAFLGIVVAIIMSKIDYHIMARLWKLHVPLAYLLVFLTFFMGATRGEADDRAWLLLPFGLSLQPAELLKVSFILSFAYHLSKVRENLNAPLNLLFLTLHGAAPVLLIHFQGDDGTALIFAFIFICMLFSAGLRLRYLAAAAGLAAIAVPIFWFFILNNDQKLRIQTIFNPALDPLGIGYQQLQGRISIGSGQIWGKGLFTGQHRYIPEIQNDFIFAFVGEALGFVGAFAVVLLLGAICTKLLFVSKFALDDLGRSICVGVFAMITFQTILNIGMCLSVLPVVGVTLPFLSAGGTSQVTLYMGIGLVLSVYMHSKISLFLNH